MLRCVFITMSVVLIDYYGLLELVVERGGLLEKSLLDVMR